MDWSWYLWIGVGIYGLELESHCLRACFLDMGLFLASLSLRIASVASDHHGENNRGPYQWIIRINITPRFQRSTSPFSFREAKFLTGRRSVKT